MCTSSLVIGAALIASVCGMVRPTAADGDVVIARVRSSDASLMALIDRAAGRSATFRRLFASIERSQGIVYVEVGTCTHGVRACLPIWMQTVGPNRFLRVIIDTKKIGSEVETMGAVGHELQHVVEALSEPGVVDGVSLYRFFSRVAPTDKDSRRFETTAAVDAGDDVMDDLRRR